MQILKLLAGKVLIGHAIHNDFKALSYFHPKALIRDTSRIPLLNQKAGFAEKQVVSLKRLTKAIFDRDIQVGNDAILLYAQIFNSHMKHSKMCFLVPSDWEEGPFVCGGR